MDQLVNAAPDTQNPKLLKLLTNSRRLNLDAKRPQGQADIALIPFVGHRPAPMNRGYDAWLVDLDGTLYHPHGVKLAMAAELVTGPRVIPVLRAFRREHEHLREEGFQGDCRTPFEEQLKRTAEATGSDEQFVRATVMRWMVEKPGKWIRVFRRSSLLDEIRAFRLRGGKTALVSDYPARSKLRALCAEALFDAIVANGEPGGPSALKPAPDGYLAAAERLGVDTKQCLVLGDRDDADGEAARRAGMAFRLIR